MPQVLADGVSGLIGETSDDPLRLCGQIERIEPEARRLHVEPDCIRWPG